jgi:hypothetical protein
MLGVFAESESALANSLRIPFSVCSLRVNNADSLMSDEAFPISGSKKLARIPPWSNHH